MRIWTALKDGEEVDNKNVFNRFFGLAGEKVSSWCGDREKFLGDITDTTIQQGLKPEYYVMREIIMKTAVELFQL